MDRVAWPCCVAKSGFRAFRRARPSVPRLAANGLLRRRYSRDRVNVETAQVGNKGLSQVSPPPGLETGYNSLTLRFYRGVRRLGDSNFQRLALTSISTIHVDIRHFPIETGSQVRFSVSENVYQAHLSIRKLIEFGRADTGISFGLIGGSPAFDRQRLGDGRIAL